MENDLISRAALINQHCAVNCGCTRSQCGFTKEEDGADCCTFVKEIEAAPAVEAEPVRHGRWEEVWCFDYMDYTHFCSECHYDALTKEGTMHDEVLTTYCPSCGCKMDGGAEDV